MAVTKMDWTQLLAVGRARERRCEALLKGLLPELPEYEEALTALDKVRQANHQIRVQMVEGGL